MMKRALLALVLALSAATPVYAQAPASLPHGPAASIDPARLAAGRALIAVVMPAEQRDKMMDGMLTAMLGNVVMGALRGNGGEAALEKSPSAQHVFTDFIAHERELALSDVRAAMPDLVEAYARAYARMFSVDEMNQIRAFYQTPAGIKFAVRGATLLRDPDVAAWQQAVAAKEGAREQGEMQKFTADLKAAFEKDGVKHVS